MYNEISKAKTGGETYERKRTLSCIYCSLYVCVLLQLLPVQWSHLSPTSWTCPASAAAVSQGPPGICPQAFAGRTPFCQHLVTTWICTTRSFSSAKPVIAHVWTEVQNYTTYIEWSAPLSDSGILCCLKEQEFLRLQLQDLCCTEPFGLCGSAPRCCPKL